MTVDSTSAVSSASSALTNPVGSSELGKDEFLQLLVAQMQYQDPLEPMKNSEFVAQLAQFSNVEQLVAVNEGINLLGVQQMGMSNAQAASFIGKEVEVSSDQIQVTGTDTEVHAGFTLEDNAAEVEVHIRDASGNLVRTINMGPQEKGEVAITWDLQNDDGGTVTPGTYTLDVTANDETGSSVTWEPRVRGVVTGVSYDTGYPELMIGSVKAYLSDIIGVYPAEETAEGATESASE